jgi:hypothetical protein
MRRINVPISFLLLFAVLFGSTSCSHERRVEYCELGIVLTDDFITYESEGAFNVAYSDGSVIVGISRYSFVDCIDVGLLTTYTPMKLAEVYLEMLDRTVDEGVTRRGDVPYFTYTDTAEDGSSFFYMPTFYRTPYAYFVITFITPKVREAEGRVEFYGYMDTVYLLEEYL